MVRCRLYSLNLGKSCPPVFTSYARLITTPLVRTLLFSSTLHLLLHFPAQFLSQLIFTLLSDSSPVHHFFRILEFLTVRNFLQHFCGPTCNFPLLLQACIHFLHQCVRHNQFWPSSSSACEQSQLCLTCREGSSTKTPLELLSQNAAGASFNIAHLLYLSSQNAVMSTGFAVKTAFITSFPTRRNSSSSSSSACPRSALLLPGIYHRCNLAKCLASSTHAHLEFPCLFPPET